MMAGHHYSSKSSAPARLIRVLLGFLLFSTLLHCAVAAPRLQWQDDDRPPKSSAGDYNLTNMTLSKRQFIPTPQQADQALIDAHFDGNKAIFYSRPASLDGWPKKLGRIPITQAYGNWLDPANPLGPFYQFTADDDDTPHWAVLSAAYARAVPDGATTYVSLKEGQVPSLQSNWVQYEEPVLQQKLCTIFRVNADNINAEPVQVFPPPDQGAPPP